MPASSATACRYDGKLRTALGDGTCQVSPLGASLQARPLCPAPLSSCLPARDRPSPCRPRAELATDESAKTSGARTAALGGIAPPSEASLVSPGWSDRDTNRIPRSSFPPWFPFCYWRLHKDVPIIDSGPSLQLYLTASMP